MTLVDEYIDGKEGGGLWFNLVVLQNFMKLECLLYDMYLKWLLEFRKISYTSRRDLNHNRQCVC